ncbi:MAG: beta-N-acetylhexosaminidase [Hydrogenovibrio sp.]
MMKKMLGQAMPLGCVMVDIEGIELQTQEAERLLDPLVGGVILFTRNFESMAQLEALTDQIHALRHPRLLIGVDHEGGRVQRFREGFTRLPAMGLLGDVFHCSAQEAQAMAETVGWMMATELLAVGVDFSFAPVVDLDYGDSRVIGDRSFDRDPVIVGQLALSVMQGMKKAGMASVAKHFPGHGYIQADSHLEVALDARDFNTIARTDLQPFLKLIEHGVQAVMPAHVRYPQVDDWPAGFSSVWLQEVLRGQCHFDGAIISDDLSMHAAAAYGEAPERVSLALKAGCDLVLVCNDSMAADAVLSRVRWESDAASHARLIRLHGKGTLRRHQLLTNPLWQSAAARIEHFLNEQNQKVLSV